MTHGLALDVVKLGAIFIYSFLIKFWLCFSSVPPPKDISFFRVEREHALRRGLQVRLKMYFVFCILRAAKTIICRFLCNLKHIVPL